MRTQAKPARRPDWGMLRGPGRAGRRPAVDRADQRSRDQPAAVLAGGLRLRRGGSGLAPGRHRSAEALAGRSRRQGVVGPLRSPRRLAVDRPGRGRARVGRRGVRAGHRPAEPAAAAAGSHGHDGVGPCRAGRRARAVALPVPGGVERGPDRTRSGRCPGRHGGPSARFGVADLGPDPASGRRPQGRAATGPAPGTGAARLAVRRRGCRDHPQSRSAGRRRRGRGRARGTGGGGDRGRLRHRRGVAGADQGRPRGHGQRRQAFRRRSGRRVRRGRRRPGRGLRPRPGSRVRPRGEWGRIGWA